MCDFKGFVPPEMNKRRRVIVIQPRSRIYIPETYLVVPVSKTSPSPPASCHCEFKPRSYDFFDQTESVWALADKVTCVASWRLDRMQIHGKYYRAQIRRTDLTALRQAVLSACGMETWREVEITKQLI
jgi:uncharacterized protein YifN (PemK superfamily)